MKKTTQRFVRVWQSQQNGWAHLTGGVSPCINCGAHHGCEPKIAIIYELNDSTADKGGLHREHLPPRPCSRGGKICPALMAGGGELLYYEDVYDTTMQEPDVDARAAPCTSEGGGAG